MFRFYCVEKEWTATDLTVYGESNQNTLHNFLYPRLSMLAMSQVSIFSNTSWAHIIQYFANPDSIKQHPPMGDWLFNDITCKNKLYNTTAFTAVDVWYRHIGFEDLPTWEFIWNAALVLLKIIKKIHNCSLLRFHIHSKKSDNIASSQSHWFPSV